MKILGEQDQTKSLADEKINMFDQADKEIDKFLLQLDKHIARFQSEVQSTPKDQKSIREEITPESSLTRLPGKRKIHKHEKDSGSQKKIKKTGDDSYTVRLDASLKMSNTDHPVDDVYCICKKHQDGQMIECDNKKCRYKWFHFKCIGLSEAPKEDKWYCPYCRQKLINKHK